MLEAVGWPVSRRQSRCRSREVGTRSSSVNSAWRATATLLAWPAAPIASSAGCVDVPAAQTPGMLVRPRASDQTGPVGLAGSAARQPSARENSVCCVWRVTTNTVRQGTVTSPSRTTPCSRPPLWSSRRTGAADTETWAASRRSRSAAGRSTPSVNSVVRELHRLTSTARSTARRGSSGVPRTPSGSFRTSHP